MIYKKLKKAADEIFFRVVSPKNNGGDKQKVVPDLSLCDMKKIYLPTTEAGSKCEWTFKTKDVALNDEDSFPLLENVLKKELKNVCYIHGFHECLDSLSARTIMNGYLERGDHNMFLLDWSVISATYLGSLVSLKTMAERTAEALRCMEDLELLRTDDLHIVGHSLGAHIAACLSRKLGSVRRVTGLDPAGPMFRGKLMKDVRISEKDAEFVDVIHTDVKKFGLGGRLGHVDFYPNGGAGYQPGCKPCYSLKFSNPKRLCSHNRSWAFYSESLVREDAFLAAAADSWEDFKCGNTGDVIPMGYSVPTNSSGLYFLRTSDSHPYGKGEDGIMNCK